MLIILLAGVFKANAICRKMMCRHTKNLVRYLDMAVLIIVSVIIIHCVLECFIFYIDKFVWDLREQVDMCKCAHVSMLEGGAKEGLMHVCCLEVSIYTHKHRVAFFLSLSLSLLCTCVPTPFKSFSPHKKSPFFFALVLTPFLFYSLSCSTFSLLLSFSRFSFLYYCSCVGSYIQRVRDLYTEPLPLYLSTALVATR